MWESIQQSISSVSKILPTKTKTPEDFWDIQKQIELIDLYLEKQKLSSKIFFRGSQLLYSIGLGFLLSNDALEKIQKIAQFDEELPLFKHILSNPGWRQNDPTETFDLYLKRSSREDLLEMRTSLSAAIAPGTKLNKDATSFVSNQQRNLITKDIAFNSLKKAIADNSKNRYTSQFITEERDNLRATFLRLEGIIIFPDIKPPSSPTPENAASGKSGPKTPHSSTQSIFPTQKNSGQPQSPNKTTRQTY